MASTYSELKFELIGTGEQAGTWGATTNTNIGTAIEDAITGSTDITFASANVTLTLTDSNTAQPARNLRLRLIGTTGGARDLIVPNISKFYIISNECADTITVKNSTGTGIAVPTGKSTLVFNNATNVVEVLNYVGSLTMNGGITGVTTFAASGNATIGGTLGVTGNATLSANATIGGTLGVTGNATLSANATVGGTLGVTGVATFTAQPILSTLTASKPVFSDGSKGLTSSGTVPIDQGGTGTTTAAQAKINLEVITAATGSEVVPAGTTAQRDGSPVTGYFRFNTTITRFEGYNGTSWGAVGGGATGGGADEVFIENNQTVTTSYSIPSGKSAMSTGPITINSGITVTVPAGSRWVVL